MRKRPNRKQLLEAGQWARERLKEKGIFREESIIDEILRTPGAPVLPGGGSPISPLVYLPRRHTIEITKMIVYSIAKVWNDTVKDAVKKEKVDEFFKFTLKNMRRSDSLITQMLQDTIAKSKFDLVGINLITTQENIKGVHRFLIDSFAVYPNLLNGNSGVSDYIEWFILWTTELGKQADKYFPRPNGSKKA